MLMHEEPLLLLVQCICELIYTQQYKIYVYLFHIFFGYLYSINVYKAQTYTCMSRKTCIYMKMWLEVLSHRFWSTSLLTFPPPCKKMADFVSGKIFDGAAVAVSWWKIQQDWPPCVFVKHPNLSDTMWFFNLNVLYFGEQLKDGSYIV